MNRSSDPEKNVTYYDNDQTDLFKIKWLQSSYGKAYNDNILAFNNLPNLNKTSRITTIEELIKFLKENVFDICDFTNNSVKEPNSSNTLDTQLFMYLNLIILINNELYLNILKVIKYWKFFPKYSTAFVKHPTTVPNIDPSEPDIKMPPPLNVINLTAMMTRVNNASRDPVYLFAQEVNKRQRITYYKM